jgi:hypothetical protein
MPAPHKSASTRAHVGATLGRSTGGRVMPGPQKVGVNSRPRGHNGRPLTEGRAMPGPHESSLTCAHVGATAGRSPGLRHADSPAVGHNSRALTEGSEMPGPDESGSTRAHVGTGGWLTGRGAMIGAHESTAARAHVGAIADDDEGTCDANASARRGRPTTSGSFHATSCEAQVVECCHGGQCRIRWSAVSREARPALAGSERVRVLPNVVSARETRSARSAKTTGRRRPGHE